MRSELRHSALAACVILAGCHAAPVFEPAPAGAPMGASPAPQSARVTAGGELVAYLARIRDLNDKALAAETQRQRESARKSDLEAVKLAIALSLHPPAEEGEIASLLEPVARRASADDDVKAMASFLLVQSAERRRLKEGAAANASRLREERRAHEAQKQRADALQERAAQLQQKMDALTELEKNLSERQVQNR